jgi:enamine deaminase RidA (YjgF/YER057c/UK114 family)
MMLSVLHPPSWPRPKGYSSAMMGTGRFVLISGQIGWDAEGRFAEGMVGQIGQALRNILDILAEAQAGPEHIARLIWYVTDMAAYRSCGKELGEVWREVMGRTFPAMAVIGVSSLVETQALVEIEAVAILPES